MIPFKQQQNSPLIVYVCVCVYVMSHPLVKDLIIQIKQISWYPLYFHPHNHDKVKICF